jgi:hypothetical protein
VRAVRAVGLSGQGVALGSGLGDAGAALGDGSALTEGGSVGAGVVGSGVGVPVVGDGVGVGAGLVVDGVDVVGAGAGAVVDGVVRFGVAATGGVVVPGRAVAAVRAAVVVAAASTDPAPCVVVATVVGAADVGPTSSVDVTGSGTARSASGSGSTPRAALESAPCGLWTPWAPTTTSPTPALLIRTAAATRTAARLAGCTGARCFHRWGALWTDTMLPALMISIAFAGFGGTLPFLDK